MKHLAWTAPLLLTLLLACSFACDNGDDDDDDNDVSPDDDDDDDDNDDSSPTPDDDDTDNPTVGACLCCFTAEEQTWGWCWNVGFADECASGCALLYDEQHLLGTLFFDNDSCLDHDALDTCRGEFPNP